MLFYGKTVLIGKKFHTMFLFKLIPDIKMAASDELGKSDKPEKFGKPNDFHFIKYSIWNAFSQKTAWTPVDPETCKESTTLQFCNVMRQEDVKERCKDRENCSPKLDHVKLLQKLYQLRIEIEIFFNHKPYLEKVF